MTLRAYSARICLVWVAVVAACLAVLSTADEAASATTGAPVGAISASLGCVNVGGSLTNSTPLQASTCDGRSTEKWALGANGSIRAGSSSSTWCMDAKGGGTTTGTPVQLYTCNGSSAQTWSWRGDNTIYNAHAALCVAVSSSTTSNPPLRLATCSRSSNAQYWNESALQAVHGPIGVGVASPGTLCVDDQSARTTNQNPIQTYSCNGNLAQDVTVNLPTLRILGQCIDVAGGATTSGTKIYLYRCNGTGAQKWTAQSDGSLLNPQSGKCLDVPGGSTALSTQLQIWTCNGTAAQRFTLPGATAPVPAPGGSIPPQTTPAPVSTSRYIRNISSGSSSELATMRSEGAADATANPSGHAYLILLDIGGQDQIDGGVMLSATTHFVSYATLVSDLKSYVDGYHSSQRASAPVVIALGTNNDMDVSSSAGAAWADRVVDPVASYSAPYANLKIAGANDIEPGFSAGYSATKSWLTGYLGATTTGFVFNGSADGCSWTTTNAGCNNGWNMSMMYDLAAGTSPTRITGLPQIYNTTMAAQWKYISLTGIGQSKPRVNFVGPLTEWTACSQAGSCGSLTGNSAWTAMWNNLQSDSRLKVTSLPYSTDLRIDS